MKNRLFLIIATTACLGSITSCSQDNDIVVPDGDLKAAISFNVNIGQAPDPQVTMRGTSTDATAGGGYTFQGDELVSIGVKKKSGSSSRTGDVIKQYTVSAGNAGVTKGSAKSLTYTGATTDKFIWLSADEVITLRAWCDGTTTTPATDPDGQPFTIETTQSGDYVKELLYSPATDYDYATYKNGITIPLYHQLARIVVNIKVEKDGYTWAGTDGVTIGHDSDGNRVPIKGVFSVPTATNYGSWEVVAYSAGNISHYGVITPKKEAQTTTDYDATYSAVVMPAPNTIYPKDMKLLNFSVGGETFFYRLPSATELKPGNQYTFYISVKNKSINVDGCTISDWGSGTSGGTVDIKKLP